MIYSRLEADILEFKGLLDIISWKSHYWFDTYELDPLKMVTLYAVGGSDSVFLVS